MARLVTKFKYLKPSDKLSPGGYAKYIATREGVDKIDESFKLKPATVNQKHLISKILRDFPDSKNSLEYEDYLQSKTVGTASEFITRTMEENASQMMNSKTYADYIATRPRAERFGSHGLFTDDGISVNLSKVSEELNLHEGNVWTAIISLRREDAERLGFNTGERWRDMLRSQTEALSANLNIPMQNLKWFAAFHNESHHPHVHLIAYSTAEGQGYLSPKGVNALRSSFAKDIFAQDLISIYEKQTEHRNTLRTNSHEVIAEIVSKINSGVYDNPKLEELLLNLADRLSKTSGKKVYGYLKADVKAIINSIIDELSADERIAALYDLWYEKREEIIRTYTDELPERVPLSQNTEFKSIKNTVIQEAMNIIADRTPIEETEEQPAPDPEPSDIEAEPILTAKEKAALMWNYYSRAKEYLDKDSRTYNPNMAVEYLIESAKLGCGVAKYRLGKMFLHGDEAPKNVDYALHWLEESVDEHNQYAEYLLGKTYLKGEDVEQDLSRAEYLLRRSSAQGNRYAKYTLGKNLFDGELFLQNIPEAIKLLAESADKGFAPAQYLLGKMFYKGEVLPRDLERAINYLERATEQKNSYAAYLAGKLRLTEDAAKDIRKAIRNFEIAAENGNDYAEYQLGKVYLYGKDIECDYEKAMAYLVSAAEHGNQYAAQLLHSIRSNRNWSAAMGTFRLLHHISRIIQKRLEDERRGKGSALIDKKLLRKIRDKKEALGMKQG
ncbi:MULTISPECIES: MobP3 family relaxase [unclassified Ruminococcus]|uniref:MobP3 family relaxase n=1 Tax=unclassified Ruminococcus TaxID=2608920 RepID=UPI00210B3846|nr:MULTISPECIES: MobP3 family relaxase [unclassified Ruminococcus]MCQ4022394.1 serine/threonine protein phosphatase [Ruminococcus sp. zg-924]MCQ4114722.1 serine/threonine protein phosphatase [Ruminococcus sp. zg-921]